MERWSHSVWVLLHAFALSCNEDKYEEWLENMKDIHNLIVCGLCWNDYKKFVTKYEETNPNYMKDSINAFKFTVDIHNHVNEKLGKPIINSYNEALESIKIFASSKPISEWRTIIYNIFTVNIFPNLIHDNPNDIEVYKQKILKVLKYVEINITDYVFENIKTFPEVI